MQIRKGVFLGLCLAFLAFCIPSASGFPVRYDSFPANVNGLTLDRTVLRGKQRSRLVKVWTLAADPENDVLTFNFSVTGGKILNAREYTGKEVSTFTVSGDVLQKSRYEVIWDLSNVPPGEYSITAGVDDGCGVCGQTKTQKVQVDPTSDEGISTCPFEFEVVWSTTYGTGSQPLRLLAVPPTGQLYEEFPPLRWAFPSNKIIAGDGSPLVDVLANRRQQFVSGTFARDPNYISSRCDFSDEFQAQLFKVQSR